MGKWLAVAGALLIAAVFVLWTQLDAPSATAVASPVKNEVATAAPAPTKPAEVIGAPVADQPPMKDDEPPKKLEVESDEFFYKFQEVVPAMLTRQAALCYEGIAKRVQRNQKLTLKFKMKIKNGDVTVNDVTIKANTLGDPGLETCFIQAVQRTTWHDDSLPDWETTDELVLRPERGMKKYMRDNIDYVGAEAPRD